LNIYGGEQITVDVVIPTFNRSETITAAVESCKKQTYEINKIIIVDDGSSIEETNHLKDSFQNDKQIKLIFEGRNGNPARCRQIGIENTTSTWIAFLDSDDFWEPNKIEKQINSLKKTKHKVSFTNALIFGNDKHLRYFPYLPTYISFKDLARKNWVINSSLLIHGDILRNEFRYATSDKTIGAEDYATWLRVATKYSLKGIDEPLTFYRKSKDSLSTNMESDPRLFALKDFKKWLENESSDLTKFYKIIEMEIKKYE